MRNRFLPLAAVAFAFAMSASAAFAFTVTTSNNATDNRVSARLADPDEIMDNMANGQTSGGMHIMNSGGAKLQFSAPSGGATTGIESRFLPNPAAQSVPSLQGH